MSLAASLTLGLLLPAAAPQDQDPGPALSSVLSEREQRSLNERARDWMAARIAHQMEESTRRRLQLKRRLERDEEKFRREFERLSERHGDLLAHVGDLLAIFDKAFPYERTPGSGTVKTFGERDAASSLLVPRSYDEDVATRTVLLLPPREKDGWSGAAEHIGATWASSALAEETIIVAPKFADSVELDVPADFSQEAGTEAETARNGAVFLPLGAVMAVYNVDRERTFLDCSAGSCLFGLRLASHFPDRFAGVILREPVDPGDLRLQSLTGVPILLVVTPATRKAAERLQQELGGSVTLIEAAGEPPYTESQAEIDAWIADVRRELFRPSVTIAPNYIRFAKSHWVAITEGEQLHLVEPEERPIIKVTADREANRITVETKGVSVFTLLLNDAIVDLGKPFTVVVNGVAVQEEKGRSLDTLIDQMYPKRDPGYLFTAFFGMQVPEPKDPGGGAKEPGGG